MSNNLSYEGKKETTFTFASSTENNWFKDDDDKNKRFRDYIIKKYINYDGTLDDPASED